MNLRRNGTIAMMVTLSCCLEAGAWTGAGHYLVARGAVSGIAKRMPVFFVDGIAQIAHCSLDPDAWTDPLAPASLDAAESSEHYFDLELLKGLTPPPRRDEYLRLCAANGLDPTKVGFLPYAINEWTGRLTVALAEYRRWPDNPHIQAKVLVYAGVLAHYAADLHQPLHVTVNWDGKVGADGQSPRTGIHLKVDALGSKLNVDSLELAWPTRLGSDPLNDPWATIQQRMEQSANLVDLVYSMESQLPEKDDRLDPQGKPYEFALRQLRRASDTTACLYLTAWRDSRAVNESMPSWHVNEREELEARQWKSSEPFEPNRPTTATAPATQPAAPVTIPLE